MSAINTNKNNENLYPNYIIDGDVGGAVEFDFFTQLKNMLNQTKNDETDNHDKINLGEDQDQDQDNYCLLTKEPLENIHIKLACGHKFNYVPLYREVVMQKTTGMTSTGYYTTHSLKRNEIKCPYCRTVQDKLLPYLEYDGVNKTMGVNHPKTLSMSVQTCTHIIECKKSKNKSSTCCKENAVHFLNGAYLCKKHSLSVATNVSKNVSTNVATIETTIVPEIISENDTCGAILRYGKNKGNPCKNSSKCRVHSKITK